MNGRKSRCKISVHMQSDKIQLIWTHPLILAPETSKKVKVFGFNIIVKLELATYFLKLKLVTHAIRVIRGNSPIKGFKEPVLTWLFHTWNHKVRLLVKASFLFLIKGWSIFFYFGFPRVSPARLWRLIPRGTVGRVSRGSLPTEFTLFTSDHDRTQNVLLKGHEPLTIRTNSCWWSIIW